MTATALRAAVGRLLTGRAGRAGRTAPRWHVGELVIIAACDRRTGRPERPPVAFDAVVADVNAAYVTAVTDRDVGDRRLRAFDFWADTGWDAWPGEATPWRLLRQRDRWML